MSICKLTEEIPNVFITIYVTILWGFAWYVIAIASLAEGWYIYCVALIHIHSRHTNVCAPSKRD